MSNLKKTITPEAYENLSEDDQDWYVPEYKKYKVKKVRRYESCNLGCDHFMGWVEEKTPIGNPYRYSKVDAFTHNMAVMARLTTSLMIDSINKSDALMERVLNPKSDGEPKQVKFTRWSR